jgi:hypothetical protein
MGMLWRGVVCHRMFGLQCGDDAFRATVNTICHDARADGRGYRHPEDRDGL